jgi:hypothetical protein
MAIVRGLNKFEPGLVQMKLARGDGIILDNPNSNYSLCQFDSHIHGGVSSCCD